MLHNTVVISSAPCIHLLAAAFQVITCPSWHHLRRFHSASKCSANTLNPARPHPSAVWRATFSHSGRALFEVITHPKLVRKVESFIGPEIVGASAYRIRPKVPGMPSGVVPWHQDSGYFSPHCDDSLILTCWIPLVDATPENGCLQVLPRVHRQGVVRHFTHGPNG